MIGLEWLQGAIALARQRQLSSLNVPRQEASIGLMNSMLRLALLRQLSGFLVLAVWCGGQGPSLGEEVSHWPHWRGPTMNGAAAAMANPPITWSESRNLRWKTPLSGLGHSTPVIWGDRIFLTTARPIGEPLERPVPDTAPGAHDNHPVTNRYQFVALAVDRVGGRILWEKSLHEALPHEGAHYTASLASASPAADGRHVFVFFGSYGLYCLDHDGGVVWQKSLGRMRSKHGHGEGSSPVLSGDMLVVNWDHEEQSFVVALDKDTGNERWKINRGELTSWASPIVVEHDGHRQVVVSGTQRVRAYDLEDGRLVWDVGGLSANVVASPVAGSGIVVAGSSYEKQAMLAVRLAGAKGDLTGTDSVLWTRSRSTPYVPSPLLHGGVVYFLRHYQNVLSRVNIETGVDSGGPFRLGNLRNIYASPIWAAGRIYVVSREGLTMVLTDTAEPEMLAVNQLDDQFSASPVAVGDSLFLRGADFLYRIAPD